MELLFFWLKKVIESTIYFLSYFDIVTMLWVEVNAVRFYLLLADSKQNELFMMKWWNRILKRRYLFSIYLFTIEWTDECATLQNAISLISGLFRFNCCWTNTKQIAICNWIEHKTIGSEIRKELLNSSELCAFSNDCSTNFHVYSARRELRFIWCLMQ